MNKKDYKSMRLEGKESLPRIESFIEAICDENNIYNDCFGNILLCTITLFEEIYSSKNQKVNLFSYSNRNGLNFEFEFNDTSMIKEFKALTNEKVNLLDDEKLNWFYILTSLTDRLSFTENSIILSFDIKSINAELASMRVQYLREYLTGTKVIHNNYLN